jgi:hypothetical protein
MPSHHKGVTVKQLDRILLALVASSLLAGCATSTQDAGPKPVIKSIALVPASNPQKVILENTNVLSGFSLWSAAAHRKDTEMKESALNSSINIRESKLGDVLTEKVVSNLRAAGFQVEVLSAIDRPKDYPDNIDIRTLSVTADAVMQLTVTYVGIYSGATSTAFNPQLGGYALLYPKGSKRALFDAEVQFGTAMSEGKPSHIKADPKFAYQGINAVYGNTVELKGLYVSGADLVARRLSDQLLATLR